MKPRINHMSKPLVDAVNNATATCEQANNAIGEAVMVLSELRAQYGDTNVLSNLIWLLEWNDLVRYAALMDESFIDYVRGED